jgi:hypothetical protein
LVAVALTVDFIALATFVALVAFATLMPFPFFAMAFAAFTAFVPVTGLGFLAERTQCCTG